MGNIVSKKQLDTNHTEYTIRCIECEKEFKVVVLDCSLDDWISGRKSIQDALPNLTPAERELFMSGICNDCWNKLFPEDEDDE